MMRCYAKLVGFIGISSYILHSAGFKWEGAKERWGKSDNVQEVECTYLQDTFIEFIEYSSFYFDLYRLVYESLGMYVWDHNYADPGLYLFWNF